MDTAHSSTDSPYEELWRGLPSSNLYKQRKLTGWSEASEGEPGDEGIEHRTQWLEADRYAALKALQDATGRDFNAVMLGVYHLVLQWYLNDFESLIGCCILAPRAAAAQGAWQRAILRPSYVYVEDDDTVESLLSDIERQLRGGNAVEIDPSLAPAWRTKRSPIFFYAGFDGPCGPASGITDLLAARFPERRVRVAAAVEAERAGVSVSMPSATAHAIGLDDFQRRYDRALSVLACGGCSRTGELREQLGEGAEVSHGLLEEMQRRMISLWSRVLGIAEDHLSESSSYFEVGGTSLNAFKLVNRIRVELQHDISIRDIIEHSTIQELARFLLKD
jgi:hypothetical protein